ncbi:hypothetical protein KIN20_024364 [Parelaphostrongylus tenuis]|uniref:Uncharacterized protein n=1 Tax=Parelaphostrongylus tenuis TaxID=148309 RepID=A0AAD5QXL3_PARTN|nr:hypothetical protein KIN20_024364 [Parelaphostrongylus tenuis]
MFAEKFEKDRAMVHKVIMDQTNGRIDKIKTFGNVDGMCLMAEYAMNEFSLRDGVIDKVGLKYMASKKYSILYLELAARALVIQCGPALLVFPDQSPYLWRQPIGGVCGAA